MRVSKILQCYRWKHKRPATQNAETQTQPVKGDQNEYQSFVLSVDCNCITCSYGLCTAGSANANLVTATPALTMEASPILEPSVTPEASPTLIPKATKFAGRLLFSQFIEASHTFTGMFVADTDGSAETAVPLPWTEEGWGSWSRSGTEIAVPTLLADGRIGTAIIATDGTLLRELSIPDPTLNLVCTVWSGDDTRLACEAWDDARFFTERDLYGPLLRRRRFAATDDTAGGQARSAGRLFLRRTIRLQAVHRRRGTRSVDARRRERGRAANPVRWPDGGCRTLLARWTFCSHLFKWKSHGD